MAAGCQTAGDLLLLTFDSILLGGEFAIETQRRINAAGLSAAGRDGRRFGSASSSDTIADQSDIHGDGVNIAVRLQSACPPGGLCISRTIHDHVEGRVGLRFHALGSLALKNVKRPIEAFCLRADDLTGGRHAPSAAAGGTLNAGRAEGVTGFPPPQVIPPPPRNSIAVLPFVSFGDDPTQAYFVDGVVDDIITELSHFRNLFVIARNSSFSYRDRNVDVREIARDLGVDYVVEGSIRRTSDRVRVAARLAYARNGGTDIRAEKFDAELTDIFALQDTIGQRIVTAITRNQAVELGSRATQANRESGCLRLLPSCNAVLRRVLRGGIRLGVGVASFRCASIRRSHPQWPQPRRAISGGTIRAGPRRTRTHGRGPAAGPRGIAERRQRRDVLCLAGHTIADSRDFAAAPSCSTGQWCSTRITHRRGCAAEWCASP